MAFRVRGFQTKLLAFMVAGLLALQLGTLAAVFVAGRGAVRQSVSEELQVGNRVLRQALTDRGRQLIEKAEVLTADFPFREVIASGDLPTITSVLSNHGDRIDADAMFLVALDGTVEADTIGGRTVSAPFPVPSLLANIESDGPAAALSIFERDLYQFVLVPVLAPQPIAYVGIGFEVDDSMLQEVRRLTAMHLTLWSTRATDPLLSSTLPSEARRELEEWAAKSEAASLAMPATVEIASVSYAIAAEPLNADDAELIVVLQRSIEEARRPFRRLELQILALSTLALLGALLAASFLARSFSTPLQRLAEGAQRIGAGDYRAPVEIDSQDELGQLATAFNQMRTGIREREQRIRHQATHDELTGLPNRTLFLDHLQLAIDQAQRRQTMIGMVMVDLDRFKEINDTLGHHFGDQLLEKLSRRLAETMRAGDTIARLGGDEFAVLFEAEHSSQAIQVAQRVAQALEAPFLLGEIPVQVNASMGISLYPDHAEDAATLMKLADIAMYDAKKNQMLVAIYEPERDQHSLRRLSVLSELRQAIADDELEVHYQPKIDLTTGKTVRAEALVRWVHQTHGLMPPSEFIPQAEQSGNIKRLTRWVLARSITDCARWNRQGFDLSVAVNLSALDLFDSALCTFIADLLENAGLPAARLALEVTESAVMKDARRATEILRELKATGIVISIDDFGTGYSSLAQLRRLPVDELKIDRSFVQALSDSSTEDQVIVRSTIELGHNMGLIVIAEGVETEAGWQILRDLGCDLAQGYFISRPLPTTEFETWMKPRLRRPEAQLR